MPEASVCASDQNDSYSNCTSATLEEIEATLRNAGSRLDISTSENTYNVVVTSKREANAVTFSLSRSANGATRRSCETGTADKGGCSAQSNGTW